MDEHPSAFSVTTGLKKGKLIVSYRASDGVKDLILWVTKPDGNKAFCLQEIIEEVGPDVFLEIIETGSNIGRKNKRSDCGYMKLATGKRVAVRYSNYKVGWYFILEDIINAVTPEVILEHISAEVIADHWEILKRYKGIVEHHGIIGGKGIKAKIVGHIRI